jgi:hypothetical protein
MNHFRHLKLWAGREFYEHRIAVVVARQTGDGESRPQWEYLDNDGWVKGGDGALVPKLHLELDDAQKLMDDLWSCGLRPAESHGSAGQLASTQKHLNDMRALVEKSLEVRLP